MGASATEIRKWVQDGYATQATHVIIVVDTFSWEDFPVYVGGSATFEPGKDVTELVEKYGGKHGERNMQRVMEVYSMKLNMDDQLAERRSFHLD